MSTMQAARLVELRQPLRIDDVAIPRPGQGEVLVAVKACGLCGTDVHLAVEGSLPVRSMPITLGHEAAGIVVETGAGAAGLAEGDRVGLMPSAACGTCRYCRRGREALCGEPAVFGMTRDGSLAEYVTAPASSLVVLPPAVPFDLGAIVTDSVATPFHALTVRGRLERGERVGVVGCGGLGTHAILLARMLEAGAIVAIDPDQRARERALAVGADLALDPRSDDVPAAVRERFGGGLDLALECVGRAETVELAIRCLDKEGRAVIVGVGPQRPSLPPLLSFVGRELAVLGSFGMERADVETLYALIAAGRLDLSGSITARYPLAGADAALRRLAGESGGVVRVIVEPGRG